MSINAKLGKTVACRACGKEIAFIKTVKGKTMPVDPEAVYFIEGAGMAAFVMIDGSVKHGKKVEDDNTLGAWIGYVSHFATCPEAGRFRKR